MTTKQSAAFFGLTIVYVVLLVSQSWFAETKNSASKKKNAILYNDVGLGFDESMSGYFSPGNVSYAQGYSDGQKANRVWEFSLSVNINKMAEFIADPNHIAPVNGTVTITGMGTGIATDSSATIDIFPSGVVDYELELHYYLPFTQSGKPYHLFGTKYLKGDDCINLLAMFTTLYANVFEGHTKGQGTIVSSGILTIGDLAIIELMSSFHMIGEGTDADLLNAVVEFATFLGIDLEDDCLNSKAYEDDFWYTWVSTGKQGFLIDLIKRPLELELRLEFYDSSSATPAQVFKQFLPMEAFKQTNDSVIMGPVTLSNSSCNGTVQNISLNIAFSLNGRVMDFIPGAVESMLPILPHVVSHYGTLIGGSCNSVPFPAKLPMVYTTYPVPILMNYWQWAMISALQFEGTDLQIEIVSTYLLDLWLATSYVYYQGKEYKLELFELETQMIDTGDISGNVRKFSANIETLFLEFSISCEAPVNYFALLEQEGNTEIHTTVLGSCVAKDILNSRTFTGSGGALLELKKPK